MVRDEIVFFFSPVDWLGLLDRDGTRRSGDAFKVASLTVPFSREFHASILPSEFAAIRACVSP